MPTCDGQQRVAADGDAVGDLHEVVDLGAGPDARLAHRRAVDGGVGADLDVVLDHHRPGLRDLLVGAVGVVREAEAVGADHRAVLHDDARARGGSASRIETRAWITAVGPEHGVVADDDVRRAASVARADAGAAPITDQRRRRRRRPRARRRRRPPRSDGCRRPAARGRREGLRGPGEGEVRVGDAQHRRSGAVEAVRRRSPPTRASRQRRRVLRVGQEGDVAGAGLLDAGHARRPRCAPSPSRRRRGVPPAPERHASRVSRGRLAPAGAAAAGTARRSSLGDQPLEERRQMLEPQPCRDLVHPVGARVGCRARTSRSAQLRRLGTPPTTPRAARGGRRARASRWPTMVNMK